MELFSFRVRNPVRDLATDKTRFRKLRQSVGTLRAEVESELAGLKRRHADATVAAASAQAAFENEGDVEMSEKVDHLTSAMIRYGDRLKSLEKQVAMLKDTENRVVTYYETLIAENYLARPYSGNALAAARRKAVDPSC